MKRTMWKMLLLNRLILIKNQRARKLKSLRKRSQRLLLFLRLKSNKKKLKFSHNLKLKKKKGISNKFKNKKKSLLVTNQEKCGEASVMVVGKCGKRKWKKRWLNLSMLELKLYCHSLLKKLKTNFKTRKKSQLKLKKKRLIIKLSVICVVLILSMELDTNAQSAHYSTCVKNVNKMLDTVTIWLRWDSWRKKSLRSL